MVDSNSGVCVDVTTEMFTLDNSYNVVFWNDDTTTQEYVVLVIASVFELDVDTSIMKMFEVHHSGSSIIGTYTYEEASGRVEIVNMLNKETGNVLKVTIENA